MIDVATWIGQPPFRHVPHPDPEILVRVLAREGLTGAWVGHLPSAWHHDPAVGNDALFQALEPFREVLAPAPTIRPDQPHWERNLLDLVALGAAAIRAYPVQWAMPAGDERLHALALACGEAGLPLVLTAQLDARVDASDDLTPAHLRALMCAAESARVVVTGAQRTLIEETHQALTPPEQLRLFWDFTCLAGPPEDDFARLLLEMGAERFVYGTHWPLRLTQVARAHLDLLPGELAMPAITDGAALSAVGKTPT